jgi:hypothetical protein
MNEFYVYFFIKQIIKILIFISSIKPVYKIGLILSVDILGKRHVNLRNLKSGLSPHDRVSLVDTVGGLFSYIQCIIILTENKMVSKEFMILLFIGILLHMLSVFNYLYKPTGNMDNERLFPDIVKPILIGFVVYSILKNKV